MSEKASLQNAEQTLEAAQPRRHAAYPEYRPSGVDWLGDVPVHWGTWKAAHAFAQIGSGTTPPTDDDAWYGGEINWVTTSELRETVITETRKKISREALAVYSALKLFPTGSVAIAMYGATIGRLGILGSPATTNQACCVLAPSKIIDTKFLYYCLWASRNFIINLSSGGGQPNISQEKIRSLRLPRPPEDEQQAIARFLDEQTKKIDDLIEAKRDLLALLKEKRQAIITHAVTKGLNPDATLKPSGVDWLGDVPEHWDVKSLKWDSPVLRGASPRPIDDPIYFDDEGEYAWVRITDVTAAGMYLEQTTQRLSKLGSSLSVKLQPGELFLSIAGSVGKPCITKIKCCIHDGFVYFPRLSCNRKFLYYIFDSGEPYKGLGKLGTQLNLNTDTVGSIHIAFPPDDVQEQIVEYLDAEMTKFDGLIKAVDGAIEKLATLRISLISAAVTGKIDVRGGAA